MGSNLMELCCPMPRFSFLYVRPAMHYAWRRMSLFRSLLLAAFLGALQTISAESSSEKSYLWDAQVTAPPSAGISPVQMSAGGSLLFSVTPPTEAADLILTICYDDAESTYLRIVWHSENTSLLLSPNLSEGVQAPHHRTLLIKKEALTKPGTLSLETNAAISPVWRMVFEWASRTPIPNLSEDASLIDATGTTATSRDLSGTSVPPLNDQWARSVIAAPITDQVEKVGSEFYLSADLKAAPSQAKLQMLIAGLPLNSQPFLSVNNEPFFPAQVATPDLRSPSYRQETDGSWIYAGWRKVETLIPEKYLRAGENIVRVRVLNSQGQALSSSLFVRDALLQLRYPPVTIEPTPPPAILNEP